jgi:hypothetical protein
MDETNDRITGQVKDTESRVSIGYLKLSFSTGVVLRIFHEASGAYSLGTSIGGYPLPLQIAEAARLMDFLVPELNANQQQSLLALLSNGCWVP